MNGVSSYQHAALIGVAAGGEEGVPKDALLANADLHQKCAFGNGAINLLVERGMTKAKAEKTMRDPKLGREALVSFFAHTVEQLIKDGRIVDTDGVLTLGTMPRGYDPVKQETSERRSTSLLNIVAARRKTKGWTYYINPKLDEGAVARLAESMQREGWPKGHTILLDADGEVADGKHHIAAAEMVSIDWSKHTQVIMDELELWQAVKARNLDRWHGTKGEVASRYAQFVALRPDLTVGEKLEAMREKMAGTSPATQRRATSATKKATKAERDAAIKQALFEGKSQREVAEELGVAKSTVANIARQIAEEYEEPPQNAQDEQNGAADPEPEPEVFAPCRVCVEDMTIEDVYNDLVAEVYDPEPGFLVGKPIRKARPGEKQKGGSNMILGPTVANGYAHRDCLSKMAQIAHRR